jgi:hypothetical protein
MQRTARFVGLIATSALTLGLLAGPARAASAADVPGDDVIIDCFQPLLVNIELTYASGGAIINEPNCSRDTFIDD